MIRLLITYNNKYTWFEIKSNDFYVSWNLSLDQLIALIMPDEYTYHALKTLIKDGGQIELFVTLELQFLKYEPRTTESSNES